MSMNGQDRPVSADLGGDLFADAAGAQQVIGCLPLSEGYSATFRNFDLQKQKPKLMQLKVAGSETVTVAAGKFETFKVEITSADGGTDQSTVWIAKDSRQAVKVSSVMGAMGGATMTAELQ
jgi:transcription antitermination factor NusG